MIHEISRTICRHLVEQLYPDYLLDRDGVQLCIPRHEHQDVQIGIYLYDISEYSITAQRYASVDGDSRVFPPKLMELSYLRSLNSCASSSLSMKMHALAATTRNRKRFCMRK